MVQHGYLYKNYLLIYDHMQDVQMLNTYRHTTSALPDDIVRYIYQYLPVQDIVNGLMLNSHMATAISHGFHLYGNSLVLYGSGSVYHMINVLMRYEGCMSTSCIDSIIYSNRDRDVVNKPYWSVINSILRRLGMGSISYSILEDHLYRHTGVSVIGLAIQYNYDYSSINTRCIIDTRQESYNITYTSTHHYHGSSYTNILIDRLRNNTISSREIVILARRHVVDYDHIDDVRSDLCNSLL